MTYKWLSKELGIHVNLSKQILFEYWEKQRREKDAISATFLLMGYHDDGEMRVEVVKEADLPRAKKNLSRIVSEHVYSLQKTLPDIELLAIADKGDSQQSAVRCNEAVVRSEHEMEVLRWGSALHTNKNAAAAQTSTAKNQKPEQAKESTAKSSVASKPQEKTQKNAFNNMFAKAIDKQSKEKAAPSGKKAKTTTPPKNAWFEAARKPKIDKSPESKTEEKSKTDKESPPEKKSKAEVTPPKKDSPSENKSKTKKSGSEEPMVVDEAPEKVTGGIKKKPAASSSSRGKKRQSTAKKESNSKRRKRIVVAESSEESSCSDAEDIREPEPDEPDSPVIERKRTCPSPPLEKTEGGRRKVRKLVDKTFMDEDGYFVTKKEYVYESCSDKEEEEVKAEVVEPATSEPPAAKNNKQKQATLLNFFKRS